MAQRRKGTKAQWINFNRNSADPLCPCTVVLLCHSQLFCKFAKKHYFTTIKIISKK